MVDGGDIQADRGASRRWVRVWLALVVLLASIPAVQTGVFLFDQLAVAGPNTAGEAGKVYYAQKVAEGHWPLIDPQEPPYYPAFHGILLHAIGGWLGGLTGMGLLGYFMAGRMVSLLASVAVALLVLRMVRWAGMPWMLGILVMLLWLGPSGTSVHATSYRPDHWNLLLAVVAGWGLMRYWDQPWLAPALAVLVNVAFFVKATGAGIGLAIVGVMLLDRAWRSLAVFCGCSGLLLAASVGLLQWGSEGLWLANLRGGLKSPFDVWRPWTYTSWHLKALVLAPVGIALLWPGSAVASWLRGEDGDEAASPPASRRQRLMQVATVFWLLSLGPTVLAMMRTGSNQYYLVESLLWAVLLLASWGYTLWRSRRGGWLRGPVCCGLLTLLLVGVAWRDGQELWGAGRVLMPRAWATVSYQDPRQVWLREVANPDIRVLSDDVMLNLAMPDPPLLYLGLVSEFIASGHLSREVLLGPIQRREYRWIVLQETAKGNPGVLQEMSAAISANYRLIRGGPGRYKVFAPLGPPRPAAAPAQQSAGSEASRPNHATGGGP